MDSVPDTRPIRRRRTVWLVASLLLVSLLACLGLASFRATMGIWDGMYPAGEYHLKIQDEIGTPINGATLNVFEGGTKNVAFEYPIDNYFSEGDLVSDEQGVIVALHKPRDLSLGELAGICFGFFQCVRMGLNSIFSLQQMGINPSNFLRVICLSLLIMVAVLEIQRLNSPTVKVCGLQCMN